VYKSGIVCFTKWNTNVYVVQIIACSETGDLFWGNYGYIRNIRREKSLFDIIRTMQFLNSNMRSDESH
jgi:hypothetical protein